MNNHICSIIKRGALIPQAHAVRHKVFVEQTKLFTEEEEKDKYDESSVHVAILYDSAPVAAMRLITVDLPYLPCIQIDSGLSFLICSESEGVPAIGEISRFCIDKEALATLSSSDRHQIFEALIDACYYAANVAKLTYWVALLEDSLIGKLADRGVVWEYQSGTFGIKGERRVVGGCPSRMQANTERWRSMRRGSST